MICLHLRQEVKKFSSWTCLRLTSTCTCICSWTSIHNHTSASTPIWASTTIFGYPLVLLLLQLFSRIMLWIPHVQCYIDNILVTGAFEEEYLLSVEEELRQFQHLVISTKRSRCFLFQEAVEYLRHHIDKGLHWTTKNLRLKPSSCQQGPKWATTVMSPKDGAILWVVYSKTDHVVVLFKRTLKEGDQSVRDGKEWTSICSIQGVVVFSHNYGPLWPSFPLCLAADPSTYVVVAVMSHVYPDGSEQPNAYVSQTLARRTMYKLRKRHSSPSFEFIRYHKFLHRRRFTMCTNHKPPTPSLAQRQQFLHRLHHTYSNELFYL